MTVLPEPPAAPAAGQAHLDDQARRLITAVEDAMRTPTAYRDDTPLPAIGTAQPVAQPGRPPMSSKATDDSVRMLAGGFLTLCAGAAVSAVLYFSRSADETVVITLCAAPPAAFLSLSALVKKIKNAVPAEIHNHYTGPVDQRNVHTTTRGMWAKTTNQQ